MSDLLLHSMSEFTELIFPCLEAANVKSVVEVGAEAGIMTSRLIDHTKKCKGELICIDPVPSPEVESLVADHQHVRLIRDISLNVLKDCPADLYLLDGDHNYYTVVNELRIIREITRAKKIPFFVFLHDAGWPCARRDQYYHPDMIPEDFRQKFVWDKGIVPGNPGVVSGGFRGEGIWACAVTEGGPQNGVLTAVEDFDKEVSGRDKPGPYLWAYIPAIFGLGVLFDAKAPWVSAVSRFLAAYHNNLIIARMEENRLANYLKVIEWQDRFHESLSKNLAGLAVGANR